MVVHRARNMRTAKIAASKARARGFNANIFKNKDGMVKVSVSLPGKNKRR